MFDVWMLILCCLFGSASLLREAYINEPKTLTKNCQCCIRIIVYSFIVMNVDEIFDKSKYECHVNYF